MNTILHEDLEYITSQSIDWNLFKDSTIVISGAAGFIPYYLIQTLLYLNLTRNLNIKIIGFVRDLSVANKRFEGISKSDLVLLDQSIYNRIEIENSVDYIIHAASHATPKFFREDPTGTILPNVLGTYNLLQLGVKKQIKGFLYFSTSGVYGDIQPGDYPIKETCFGGIDPMDLASCYIESKRMGENMCAAWLHQYKLCTKVVRPSITYGYGIKLNDGRSFADFISNILQQQDIILYSKGQVFRNFCYIADATVGFFKVLLHGNCGEAYNVASDYDISIVDLAHLLVEKVFPELKLKVVFKDDKDKQFLRKDFSRTTTDISKLQKLDWSMHYSLEEGFRRTVEYYKLENYR